MHRGLGSMVNNFTDQELIESIKIPSYSGLEICYEDIVYSFFRLILNKRGYSFKVKKTGFPEIDSIIPSYASGKKGMGLCDGYIFSNSKYESFFGLVELETTGNIQMGINQIKNYINGFKKHPSSDKILETLKHDNIRLIVYDGQKIFISVVNLKTQKEEILFDCEPVENITDFQEEFLSLFPIKEAIRSEIDEKKIIGTIANIIRGHEVLQKNKAILMTILASIYGVTKKDDLRDALTILERSQVEYEKKLHDTWFEFQKLISDENDKEKLNLLYERTASQLFQLSQNKGMDLYGFIYEELATRENKKEQGEYYTPRHTIRPVLSAIFNNYLNWDKNELKNKIIVDPFCGSGGFLYEYIRLLKQNFNLSEREIDKIAHESIYGFDKNSVLAAYLNLYLIGDGNANIKRVKTSINWRAQFLYKQNPKDKNGLIRNNDDELIEQNLRLAIQDISAFIQVYAKKTDNLEIDSLKPYFNTQNPINQYILANYPREYKNENFLGNVDLLMTNVPYGKVTDATDQIFESGKRLYGSSLEVNALRECVDLLKPAEMKNNHRIREGGIGVIIIPDSILENPTNKPIRDYLIKKCDVLAIISLPLFTFSPYAMEKTYVIVIQKIAPDEFKEGRNCSFETFMYYSLCDGRANSENRYQTNRMQKTIIKTPDNNNRQITEFIHNDFDPCFEPYEYENKIKYLSKLERAWDNQTVHINPEWDQVRVTEVWDKSQWKTFPGKKWGYFKLVYTTRNNKTIIKKGKTIEKIIGKINAFLESLDESDRCEYLIEENFEVLKEKILSECRLSPKEKSIINLIGSIEIDESDENSINLIKYNPTRDIDLNPDSANYLGEKERVINVNEILTDLSKHDHLTEEILIDYFKNRFFSDTITPIKLIDKFDVIQGTQFSKQDAYLYAGSIPVFTAATTGPAYYADPNIEGKVKLTGPALIWSRKGAKAGTIQLFEEKNANGEYGEFYISDVSGAIKPKKLDNACNLLFLKYYIGGQVKRELQSKTGNAQLNKSKLENLELIFPENFNEIGELIKHRLSP
jgi:hypothetical protein